MLAFKRERRRGRNEARACHSWLFWEQFPAEKDKRWKTIRGSAKPSLLTRLRRRLFRQQRRLKPYLLLDSFWAGGGL